jgi:hypothetical protein
MLVPAMTSATAAVAAGMDQRLSFMVMTSKG